MIILDKVTQLVSKGECMSQELTIPRRLIEEIANKASPHIKSMGFWPAVRSATRATMFSNNLDPKKVEKAVAAELGRRRRRKRSSEEGELPPPHPAQDGYGRG